MKIKLINSIAFTMAVSFMMTSCIKDDVPKLGDAGSTFVKILEAPENKFYFSPFTDVKKLDLFSVRKDANSSAKLNQATTIKLTRLDNLIADYNDANGTSFEPLPDSLFTTSISQSGGVYDMSMTPGQFAKEFTINLDGSKWDVSHTYALAVAISDAGGTKVRSGMDTIIAFLSIKNKYDGKYTVTGTMVDFANGGLTGNYPWDVELRTSGPNSVIVWDVENDYILHPILNGSSWSYYGSFGMEFTFDPVTDAVVSVTNPYGQPAGNGRSAELDPSGVNLWNTDLTIKYWMNQPSIITPHRVSFDEVYKYAGPR